MLALKVGKAYQGVVAVSAVPSLGPDWSSPGLPLKVCAFVVHMCMPYNADVKHYLQKAHIVCCTAMGAQQPRYAEVSFGNVHVRNSFLCISDVYEMARRVRVGTSAFLC